MPIIGCSRLTSTPSGAPDWTSKLPNTMAGVSPGATSGLGFLLYRVYLPDRGRGPAGGVGLPTLTIDGKPRRTCSAAERTAYNRLFGPLLADAIAANAPDPADATLDPALFRKASGLSGLFTNPDNQYLYAASAPAPGRVVVIRGKAATFPDTRGGQSVTVPTQLRYWSWCSNELANPYPVVQCAADDQVPLDAKGYYTVAISMPQDRPSNATRANGVTWLAWQRPTSSGQVIPNVTYLRNMLPNSSFAEAVQNVPDPAADSTAQQQATQAKASMGAYYPVGVYCTKTQFESQGPLNCA